MEHKNPVFGIYRTSQQAEVTVDKLIEAGFQGGNISVLHPDNQSSRDFANKKHTRSPKRTVEGESATAPLEGTWGLMNPAKGPIRGALPEALAEMGIANDWPGVERLLNGEVLFSVQCDNTDDIVRAIRILKETGAEDID